MKDSTEPTLNARVTFSRGVASVGSHQNQDLKIMLILIENSDKIKKNGVDMIHYFGLNAGGKL